MRILLLFDLEKKKTNPLAFQRDNIISIVL